MQIGSTNFYRIETIGDGSCLLHAICLALLPEYKKSNFKTKTNVVHKLRCDIAKFLCQESSLSEHEICLKLNIYQLQDIGSMFFFKKGNIAISVILEITDNFFNYKTYDERLFFVISKLKLTEKKNGTLYTDQEIYNLMTSDPRILFQKKYPEITDKELQLDYPITLNYYAYSKIICTEKTRFLNSIVNDCLTYDVFLGDDNLLPFIPEIFNLQIIVIKKGYTQPYTYFPENNCGVCCILYNDEEVHWELIGRKYNNELASVFNAKTIQSLQEELLKL